MAGHGFLAFLPLAASAALTTSSVYQTLRASAVIEPQSGKAVSPVEGLEDSQKLLVVLLPQLGEFDSSEFVEQLVSVMPHLSQAGMALRVVGIGDTRAAQHFSSFTGLPLEALRTDPSAALHQKLGLHDGPALSFPDFMSDEVLSLLLSTLPGGKPKNPALLRPTANAWLRYLAMCAGIGAPGTLPEILRGYLGDRAAPERLAPNAIVTAGPVRIGPGVGPVKIGPIEYSMSALWNDESGYQRPVELATVRLRNMVEVLTKWDDYVSNPTTIAQRGATYLFEGSKLVYEHRHPGVLTYSDTMSRPLAFLTPYIGEQRARNPLGLGDQYPPRYTL